MDGFSEPLSADDLRTIAHLGYIAGCDAGSDDYRRGVLPLLPDYIHDRPMSFAFGFASGYHVTYNNLARPYVQHVDDDIPSPA